MFSNQVRGMLALMGVVGLGAWLSAAWPQPPEGKIDPADPLMQSIKERMGKLPRLDPNSQGDGAFAKDEKKKGAVRKYRAAELMLKSARLLESEGEGSQELLKIAKDLRKQVVVVLESD